MFIFQSLHNTFDFQLKPKKVITFHGGMYSTNDPALAAELRARQNHDFWEVPPKLVVKEQEVVPPEGLPESVEVPKRKGRPPKVQVVQGARSSDLLDK